MLLEPALQSVRSSSPQKAVVLAGQRLAALSAPRAACQTRRRALPLCGAPLQRGPARRRGEHRPASWVVQESSEPACKGDVSGGKCQPNSGEALTLMMASFGLARGAAASRSCSAPWGTMILQLGRAGSFRACVQLRCGWAGIGDSVALLSQLKQIGCWGH